jgi:hypothetical protein
MSQAKANPGSSTKETAKVLFGSAILLVTLWIAALLTPFLAIAFAQEREDRNTVPGVAALPAGGAPQVAPTAFDLAALPSLDSIDAQTDITVFLQSDVPAELQVAALRRAWTADPAIRDFKEMAENDWDFEVADGIPGFGDLGPEVDIQSMLAGLFSEPARLAYQAPKRPDSLYGAILLFANWLARPLKT